MVCREPMKSLYHTEAPAGDARLLDKYGTQTQSILEARACLHHMGIYHRRIANPTPCEVNNSATTLMAMKGLNHRLWAGLLCLYLSRLRTGSVELLGC